jgi:hypothetical protein
VAMLVASSMLPAPAHADAGRDEVPGNWDSIRAYYLIHSGGATYPEPPTTADRALTVLIEGKPAREVFDRIGPDAKVTCSSERGDRERRNKGVSCTYTAQLTDPKESHYRCWIGINLRTGEGDVRISC